MIEPTEVRDHWAGGPHRLYDFPNGYTASVFRNAVSWFRWELAVMVRDAAGKTHGPVYDTPITSDVERCDDEEELQTLLVRVRDLPPRAP